MHFHIALSMLHSFYGPSLQSFLWVDGIKLLKLAPIGHMNQAEPSLKLYLCAINGNALNIQQIWAALGAHRQWANSSVSEIKQALAFAFPNL